jgi:hypothetical protein
MPDAQLSGDAERLAKAREDDAQRGPFDEKGKTMPTTITNRNKHSARRAAGSRACRIAASLLAFCASAWAQSGAWSNITGYAIPTADSSPGGITAGPDGARWFTEDSRAEVGWCQIRRV